MRRGDDELPTTEPGYLDRGNVRGELSLILTVWHIGLSVPSSVIVAQELAKAAIEVTGCR